MMVTSEYVFPTVLLRSRTAANDEVMTTRLTVGALFLIDLRIPVVPIIAMSNLSDMVLNLENPAQRRDTWVEQFFLHVFSIEVIRAGRMNNGRKRRVRNDSFVECWIPVRTYVNTESNVSVRLSHHLVERCPPR